MGFKKATREKAKARMCFIGPSGSGKTFSALTIAKRIGKKVALIDTEHGSASKYAEFGFDVMELDHFSANNYVLAIEGAEKAGYDTLIIDSLSHAWTGKGGILEFVDHQADKNNGNKFAGWNKGTEQHNKLVNTMISCNMHLFVTMRSKTEYVVEKNEKGKSVPRKVGIGAIQRDGIEYEFDVVGEMTQDNTYVVTKTRCPELNDRSFNKPGNEMADLYGAWLNTGVKAKRKPLPEAPDATPSETDEDPNETREEDTNRKGFPKEPKPLSKSVEGVLERVTKSGGLYHFHFKGGGGPFSTQSKKTMERACSYKRQNVRIHFLTTMVDGKTQFTCSSIELIEK